MMASIRTRHELSEAAEEVSKDIEQVIRSVDRWIDKNVGQVTPKNLISGVVLDFVRGGGLFFH